jgi:hypothetical protein
MLILVLGMIIWNPADRGGRLDTVANEIRSQWRTGDQLVYTTVTVGMPFSYYLGDLPHAWDDTVREEFLMIPTYPRDKLAPPIGKLIRSWVVIPQDGLISPGEKAALMDLVHHQKPVYTVSYMQAAAINVYLVK